MEAKWKFREMSKGEMNSDPIEGEFFTVDHLDSITDALVRETIQNSLDAGLPGEQVFVRFHIAHPVDEGAMESYFSSLRPHLEAKQNGLIDRPVPQEPVKFILVEDYGTRGLEGDYMQDNDLEHFESKNDFFYFWRNVGRSGKSEGDRGRWGLGKTVFQAASRINSFWGVTVRQSDMQTLLMGQSVIKTHMVLAKKHYPYGWYGAFEDDFPLPVNDAFVKQFCKDFLVDRMGKTGLSVVIPFPDPAIDSGSIIGSVLVHYFFPILGGSLVVEVVDQDKSRLIGKDNIDQYVPFINFGKKKLSQANFRGLFDLARWAINLKETGRVELKMPAPHKAPELTEALFDREIIGKMKDAFEEGGRIALRVPLQIQAKGKRAEKTYFDIFVERDPGLEMPEDHFVREGITLAGVKSLRQRGVRVIVSVEDKALSTMLGDAENPAHTEWQERSPKFQGKYERGASCLRFVKNSPREIVNILTRPAKGKDLNLLIDILFVDIKETEPSSVNPDLQPKPGEKGKQLPTPELPASSDFVVIRVKGGFRIIRNKNKAITSGSFIISAAYALRRGNPFSKYSPFDFEMNKPPIKVRVKNIKVLDFKRNQILAQVLEPDFVIEVVGFDPHRDLVVKAVKLSKDVA